MPGLVIPPSRACAAVLLVCLLTMPCLAQALDYQDPVGYPASWPDGAWKPYTLNGQAIGDLWSSSDATNGGTTPNGAVDLVNTPAAYYYGDGTVLFLRFRIDGSPLELSGSSQPYLPATWSLLIDIDGDGYREFAVMLDGMASGGSAPDDIVVLYNDDPTQGVDPEGEVVWKQDAARHPSTPQAGDGEPGDASVWDGDASAYAWDFGRTRVTQIDEAYAPGSNRSEYYLDVQLPLEALAATELGGPQLTSDSVVRFAITTANSNTDPAQQDFVYLDGYQYDGPISPLPFGDALDLGGGQAYLQPVVTAVEASAICTDESQLIARVSGVIETWSGDRIRTTVNEVDFFYRVDPNANGVLDSGEDSDWSSAGTMTMSAGVVAGGGVDNLIGPWRLDFDGSQFPSGPLLIKAVASDSYFRSSDSLDVDENSPQFNPATKSQGPVYGSLVNSCGSPPAGLVKSVSKNIAAPGETLSFTLSLTNPADSEPYTLSELRDVLPPDFAYGTVTGGTLVPSTVAFDDPSDTVTWTFPDTVISPGATETLLFSVTVSDNTGAYANSARATTSVGELESTPVQIGVGASRLGLTVLASLSQADPGDALSYDITYRNDSAINASEVILTAVVPAELTLVSTSPAGAVAGNTITWTIGNLPSGDGPYTFSVATTIDDPYPSGGAALLQLPVTLDAAETSPLEVRAATFVNAPRAQLGLGVTERNSLTTVDAGTQVQFDLSFENSGAEEATGIVLSVPIPLGFSHSGIVQPDSPTIAGNDVDGYVASWEIGSLATGSSGMRTLVLDVVSEPAPFIAYLESAGVAPVTADYHIGLLPDEQVSVCDYALHAWYLTQPATLTAPLRVMATTTPAEGSSFYIPNGHNYWVSQATVNGIVREKVFMIVEQDLAHTAALEGEITSAFIFYKLVGGPVEFEVVLRAHHRDVPTQYHMVGGQIWSDVAIGGLTGQPGQPYTLVIDPPLDVTGVPEDYVLEFTFKEVKAGTATQVKHFHIGDPSMPSTFSHCYATPLLLLDTQVDKLSVGPGGTLSYELHFDNVGIADAANAEIVDTLPVGVQLVSVERDGAPIAYSQDGQVVTVPLGSIPANGAGPSSVAINVAVDDPLDESVTGLLNHALLRSDSIGAVPVEDSVVTSVTRVPAPSLHVAKRVDDSLLLAGETATFTVELINSGLVEALNVSLTDRLAVSAPSTLPEYGYGGNATLALYDNDGVELTAPTLNPPSDNGDGLAFVIGGDGFTLQSGHRLVLTYPMIAGATVPAGLYEFTSGAEANADGLAAPSTSPEVTVTVSGNANLRIELEVASESGETASVNEVLTYTATAWNAGPRSATEVRLSAVVPAMTSYLPGSFEVDGVSVSDEDDGDGARFDAVEQLLALEVGDLAPGVENQVTMSWQVLVDPTLPAPSNTVSGKVTATAANAAYKEASSDIAAIAAPIIEAVMSGPRAVGYPLTTLAQAADNSLTVTLTSTSNIVVGDWVSIGDTVVQVVDIDGSVATLTFAVTAAAGTSVLPVFKYVVTYSNTGTTAATGVDVSNVLDASLQYISGTPMPTSAPTSGTSGSVSWELGDLDVGASGMVTLLARPAAAKTYANAVTVDSNETEASGSNTVTTVAGGVSIVKSVTNPTLQRNELAEYRISVTNTTAASATLISVTDHLPIGFTYDGASNYASTGGRTALTCATSPAAGDAVAAWSDCTVPANSTRWLSFNALIGNAVQPGTYDNEVWATSDSTAVIQFAGELTTAEDVTVTAGGAVIEGFIYNDVNANGVRDPGEDWSEGVTVRLNLIDPATGVVSLPIEVARGDGSYRFAGLNVDPVNPYKVIVTDNHASSVPTAPPGWIFLEPAGGEREVLITVADSITSGQDFGLYFGTRVAGTVHRDDGYSNGTANNGRRDGEEELLTGVEVTVYNGPNNQSSFTDSEGAFSFLIPSSWGSPVSLVHDAGLTTGVHDGFSVTLPGSISEADDFVLDISTVGGGQLDRNIGAVPESSFTASRSGEATSPGSVSYLHWFKPGTAGGAEFFFDGTLDYEYFLDADCDGEITGPELFPVEFTTVDGNWPRAPDGTFEECLVQLQVLVPPGLTPGKVDIASAWIDLRWEGNIQVVDQQTLMDTTTVRENSQLLLNATVENISNSQGADLFSQAKPGEHLEYCVSYQNIGVRPLTEVEVTMPVPFHTDFRAAPYAGGADVRWTRGGTDEFLTINSGAATMAGRLVKLDVGNLIPGQSGSLCFQSTIR